MEFINPSLKQVFDTLTRNDDLVNFLKEKGLVLTRQSLYGEYEKKTADEMSMYIYLKNVQMFYDIAEILLENSQKIKSTQIWQLKSNKVVWDDLAGAMGITSADLTGEIYHQIMYCYKYCVVSSFFQNNKDRFMPEEDFYNLEQNGAGMAFYDAMMKEFDKLDCVISKCVEYMDYDKIPWDLINYLTQLLGFEKATINADEDIEEKYRELAKNILDIYRIKGTEYSFQLLFNFLGFNIEIKEYYFDRRLYYTTNEAGNSETSSADNADYQFYLTIHNPTNNELGEISINETVTPHDLTPQYSLHEFNELCNTYGPAAVLGYVPYYYIKDENGTILETKEYTGKVYKYFKTNLIYYSVGADKKNLNEKQIVAITKYLDFLTPSYVMRQIEVETYSEKAEEDIAFDGDGSKKADVYGNFEGFEILDSEDWETTLENSAVKKIGGKLYKAKDNDYDGETEKLEEYKDSVGESKFRIPLGYKINRVSTSKYLTGGTGTNYLSRRRVKYYIHRECSPSQQSFDWEDDNVIITPYYTIPPFVSSNTHYNSVNYQFYENTSQVNLLGGDGNGNENCVKTQIRDANIRRPVDFVTDLPINEFVNSDAKFNELIYGSILARDLNLISTVKYGKNTPYRSMEEAYESELRGYHICNVNHDNFSINDLYGNSSLVSNLNKNKSIVEGLTLNKCILGYSGNFNEGTLYLYRYGPVRYPIKSANYDFAYITYLRSFRYKLVKAYNHSLNNNGSVTVEAPSGVAISGNYTTKVSLKAAESSVQAYYDRMVELTEANPTDSSKWLDINYVENRIFFISSTGDYYIAVKYSAPSALSSGRYDSGRSHIFNSLQEALSYFDTYPNEKHNNAEFYVNGEGLYSFHYKNRYKPVSVFSTADEQLYKVLGNGKYDVVKDNNFFGRLTIERYSEDPQGIYVEGDDGLMYNYGFINNQGLTEIEYENGFKKTNDKTLNHTESVRTRYSKNSNGSFVKAEINDYDIHWAGYDEEADEQDFIFYNSSHVISWGALGIDNEAISRPVKAMTDKNFNSDEQKLNTTSSGSEEDKANYAAEGYYKTIGQKIVREIVEDTANNFTDKEKINWSKTYNYYPVPEGATISANDEIYEMQQNGQMVLTRDTTALRGKRYFTYSCIGLLSIIEENMEKLTGVSYDRTFDYYSTISQFFVDYYRLIILGNTSRNSIPSKILSDFGSYNNDLLAKINKYYKRALYQIAGVIDTISQNRVYYAYIGNWKTLIAPNHSKYTSPENDGVWNDDYYNDPLGSAAIDKNGYRKNLGEGHYYYYFPEKTAFVNIIKYTIEKLEANFSVEENEEKVRYFKTNNLDDYLGIDAYSLKVNNKYDISSSDTPWHDVIYNGFTHYYQDYKGEQKVEINETFYLLRDSNYNYFIPYALKFGLRNYSKDFYDEHREIYSEFTELVDLFSDGEENTDGFLKQYYYNKLVSLYREANIQDVYPLGVRSDGKKPMQLMPKLSEKFNGLAGQYRSAGTLLSSRYNNGGEEDTGIKLKFFKFDMSVDENLKATMKFYVNREDFTKAFGYDFNRYYIKKDLSKVSSSSLRAQLREAIDLMYRKQFSNIKPYFTFYDAHPSYYPLLEDVYEEVRESDGKVTYVKKTITNPDGTVSIAKKEVASVWQSIRNKLTCDYTEASALLVDENYKAITDEEGNLVDTNGYEINVSDSEALKKRLNSSKYIIITVTNDTSLLSNPEARNVFQIDGHQNEEKNNICGYLSVKQLRQKFIDNYISFPKSLDWIEKDDNNIASEYISFGDDRAINITIKNNLFSKDTFVPSVDPIVFFDKEYYKQEEDKYVRVSNKELKLISNPSEAGLFNKEILADGLYYNKYIKAKKEVATHDEEVIKTSFDGYPYVYENGEEKVLINYDRHLLLEDQGIKPVYVKVPNEEIKLSYNSKKFVYNVDGKKEKNYVCENIYYDADGNLILQLNNDYLHTSDIKNLKLVYLLLYITAKPLRIKSLGFIPRLALSFSTLFKSKNFKSVIAQHTYNIYANINTRQPLIRVRAGIKKVSEKVRRFMLTTSKALKSLVDFTAKAATVGSTTFPKAVRVRAGIKKVSEKVRRFMLTTSSSFKTKIDKINTFGYICAHVFGNRFTSKASLNLFSVFTAFLVRTKGFISKCIFGFPTIKIQLVFKLEHFITTIFIETKIPGEEAPSIRFHAVNSAASGAENFETKVSVESELRAGSNNKGENFETKVSVESELRAGSNNKGENFETKVSVESELRAGSNNKGEKFETKVSVKSPKCEIS